jgi:hypothetical protein
MLQSERPFSSAVCSCVAGTSYTRILKTWTATGVMLHDFMESMSQVNLPGSWAKQSSRVIQYMIPTTES